MTSSTTSPIAHLDRIWRFFLAQPVAAYAATVAALLAFRLLLNALGNDATVASGSNAYWNKWVATLGSLATILTIALPFQLLIPAVQRRPKITTYEFWLDLLYWHQGLVLSLLSFTVVIESLSKLAWSWTSGPWLPFLRELPFWLQVTVAIWAFDLVVYWRHRAEHTFRPLWSFHAVHHSTRQVDVLTTLRLHPFELLLGSVSNGCVALLGLEPRAMVAGYILYTYYNYFIHTNVRIRFAGIWKYVFVSPFMHQWHHALDREAAGKNVGVVFAWNDWVFRTAYHPKDWPTEFGMHVPPAERLPQSYVRQLLYPVQYVWAQFRKMGRQD